MKISEIFYSVQGEGVHTGKPAVFVRFFDCNLACSFCDEPLHRTVYEEKSEEEVLEEIESYPARYVVLTGGEPTLYELNGFIRKLRERAYFVSAETNGYNPDNIRECDWVTFSPKGFANGFQPFFDELKIVVNSRMSEDKIVSYTRKRSKPVFIQPEADGERVDMDNVDFCVNLVKKFPFLRLSLQTHKLIGQK